MPQAQRVTGRAAPGGFSLDAAAGYERTLSLVGKHLADLPSGERQEKSGGALPVLYRQWTMGSGDAACLRLVEWCYAGRPRGARPRGGAHL